MSENADAQIAKNLQAEEDMRMQRNYDDMDLDMNTLGHYDDFGSDEAPKIYDADFYNDFEDEYVDRDLE